MPTALENYLPHRPPFLFVNEVDATDDGKRITGHYTFTEDNFFFAGHFPGNPVVPGVILVETLAQCGGAGLSAAKCVPDGVVYTLASIDEVKFHRMVRPNERLDIEVETLRLKKSIVQQEGKGYVNGELALSAKWLSAFSVKS